WRAPSSDRTETDRFDDDDWLVQALNEFLDPLHAKITTYDDHAELEGVIPLSIPPGPDSTPENSPYESQLPRELEGGSPLPVTICAH
ncbi:MAG: hypothetical protein J4N66_04100, partial [Chloroflexi bacterium]|nr:hypothetical protein [Chloroflexota bacterium]